MSFRDREHEDDDDSGRHSVHHKRNDKRSWQHPEKQRGNERPYTEPREGHHGGCHGRPLLLARTQQFEQPRRTHTKNAAAHNAEQTSSSEQQRKVISPENHG